MNRSIKKIILSYITFLMMLIPYASGAPINKIENLDNLDLYANEMLKSLRKDVRKTIYIIKSRREENSLPELKFFLYRVKKDDTFWTILSRSSLDMDTLLSVNGLASPKDILPGKKIYIPNMRGIVVKGSNESVINKILKKNRILPLYVHKINKSSDFNKKYIFIPCGKISNLERSLFMGIGFIYPLRGGRRTSGFGRRRNPFNKRRLEFHTGIDIACRNRTKILAARDGKVIFSGFKGGYGRLVIIKHEHDYMSYYGHLSKSLVKPGQVVQRGKVIALSGNTGRTTGPHLHFEIRKGKRPINPGILLRK